MRRRCFLSQMLLLTLAGCGSDSTLLSGGGSVAPTTGTQSGQVNPREIGGKNWSAQTAFSNTRVSSDGSVALPASTQAAQLFFLLDQNGALRAMTVSFPDLAGPIVFDAAQTALAVAFCTPGIAVLSPAKAAIRREQLRGLASFEALIGALRLWLPRLSLQAAFAKSEVSQALLRVVREWSALFSPKAIVDSLLSAQFNGLGGVTLRNGASRFVSVKRQDFDLLGNLLAEEDLGMLAPASLNDWSELFQWDAPPSVFTDSSLNLSQRPEVARVVYTFVGLTAHRLLSPSTPAGPQGAPEVPSPLMPLLPMAALLAGELAAQSASDAPSLFFDHLLSELQQNDSQEALEQLLAAAQKQSEANQKSGVAKAFAWIATALSAALRAGLLRAGTGTPPGVALIFGGLTTAAVQLFQFLDVEAFLELALKHWGQLAESQRIELVV